MAQAPCTVCGKRLFAKPHSIYVSWFQAGTRRSYRHSLCHGDAEEFAATVKLSKPLRADKEDEEWPDNCSVCGQDTAEDLEPIYLTVYAPKSPQLDLVIPTCAVCQTNVAGQLAQGGILQTDRVGPGRNGSGGAPPPSSEAVPVLAWT